MRKIVIAVMLAVGILGLVACSSGNSEVVVKTNVGDISKEEFYDKLKEQVGEQVLQEMVTIKVLEDKFTVDDKEVDEQVDEAKEQLGEQFEMWLTSQGYGDEEAFRELIRVNLLFDEAIYGDVEISDEEVSERYDRMKTEIEAQHILVEDEELANEIKEKIDAGEDFAELAKEHSTDGSAEQGGDLGYFSAGKMVAEFEDAAYSMDVDTISDPVKSQWGYHIIKVNDKREVEAEIGSFEDMEESIRQELKMQKVPATEAQAIITQLIDDAKVDVKISEYEDLFQVEG